MSRWKTKKNGKKCGNQRGKYNSNGALPSNASENSGVFVSFSVPHHQKGRRSLSSGYFRPDAVTGISGWKLKIETFVPAGRLNVAELRTGRNVP